MSADDSPDIAGLNEPDGARIIVNRPAEVQGVNGSGGTATEFRASPDGPLMRFLLSGHA
jgi:hypothetical protein